MNILLSKTEQELLFLLEELTKHHDWIEIPVLAEKLNFSIRIARTPLSLSNYFPNLLLQSRKKAFDCSLKARNSLDPGLLSLNNLKPTLFELSIFQRGTIT